MIIMALFEGSGVALVTPFSQNGSVNFEEFEKMIEWHIANGTDAIIVAGTTGEASTLSDEEHMEAIKRAVALSKGRIQIVAGTGSNDTSYAVMLSKFASDVGADAILSVTPYYNKATQKGLIAHFTAIADAVEIPVILYNVPGRTGVNIQPATVAELAKHRNIKGIKEASGDIAQCCEIKRLVPEDFKIYSGNDDMIVPLLSLGGHGVISVLANVMPQETHDLCASYMSGDTKKSLKIQLDTKPLTDALFCEVNPIPVKKAVELLGFNVGSLRLPLTDMEPQNVERLKKEMDALGLVGKVK
jgi:4-hydroxy-tetrahydrodipicolinate synthase